MRHLCYTSCIGEGEMAKVCVCASCGKTLESDFLFCPWCGTSAIDGSLPDERLEAACRRVSALQLRNARDRIARMEDELGELESALSLLLAGSQ